MSREPYGDSERLERIADALENIAVSLEEIAGHLDRTPVVTEVET